MHDRGAKQPRRSIRFIDVNRRRRLAFDPTEYISTVLLACLIACLLASAVGVATLLSTLQFGPGVGEILQFGPYAQMTPEWRIEAVRSSDHRRCVLKPAIMGQVPGSMVVEQRLPDGRTFRTHWAGGPTSDGDGNCGSAADLTLGLVEMQTLVNADAATRHSHFVGI
jgi:hypothetical protein